MLGDFDAVGAGSFGAGSAGGLYWCADFARLGAPSRDKT
jgi:hypothetical protein